MATVERTKKGRSKGRSFKKENFEVSSRDLEQTVPEVPNIEEFLPDLEKKDHLALEDSAVGVTENPTTSKDPSGTETNSPPPTFAALNLNLLETDESSEVFYPNEILCETENVSQNESEACCASAPPLIWEENSDCLSISHAEDSQTSLEYVVQPFTESQLRGLYINREISVASEYVSKFLSDETETSSDPFYKLLEEYCCSRQSLITTEKSFQKLIVAIEEDKVRVWNLENCKSEVEAECQDHRKVTSVHSYLISHFNSTISSSLTSTMKQIRELLIEQVSVYLFQSNLKRLEVDEHLNKVCGSQEINEGRVLRCISVLFSFMRKRCSDEKFVKDVKSWLEQTIGTLYFRFNNNFEHHLFLLNHVLRCPPGMGKWCAGFIQPPVPLDSHSDDVDFQNLELNQMLALVSTMLSPVKERKDFLPEYLIDLSRSPNKPGTPCDSWTVLDSDGEEDAFSSLSHSQPPMRENDIVAVFNQMPIDAMFRYLLRIEQRDGEDVYSPSNFSLSGFVKLCAFATQFIELLKCGLATFDAPTYQQFAKRIGRLVSHTVQYVSDHWQAFYISNGSRLDPAMCQRIQVEHDSFFLRAVTCILSSRNMGMWQYLAVLPFRSISIDMLWKTYAHLNFISDDLEGSVLDMLHTQDSDKIVTTFQTHGIKSKFLESFEILSSNERIFLLTTFSKMASSRSYLDKSFIETVFLQLIEVGFLTASCFDNCNKPARDLLSDITGIHPWIITFFVNKIEQSKNVMGLGKNVLHLTKSLPLSLWRPDDNNTFYIVCQWLTEYPPTSIESHLARIIFEKMDWTIQEKVGEPSKRALNWNFHRSLALSVVEANIKHAPDIIQETGLLQEGIRHMSNIASFLYKKSPEQILTSWSWEMVSKLRLHSSDQSSEDTLGFYQKYLNSNISKLDDYVELSASVVAKSPLACYVALQLTDVGHSRDEIISKGLSCIELLTLNGRYDHVMEVLLHVVPIFIRFPEQFSGNDLLRKIVETIVFDDQTYIQSSIDLIASDNHSPVLKEFRNMITKQLLSFPKYGLLNEVPLAELWIRILTKLNKWNSNKNTLYLINSICKTVFNKAETMSKIKSVLSQILEELRSVEKGGFFSWKTDDLTCVTLVPISASKFPWFSFVSLEAEESTELFQKTWPALVAEFSFDESMVLETALKTVAQVQGIQIYGSNNLPIYKWSKLILDVPYDHPIQPLFAQKFFYYFLSRQSSSHQAVGHKFFSGIVNSMYFGRLQTKFKAILEFYEGSDGDVMNNNLRMFFNACVLWCEDQLILCPTLHLPSLSPGYLPERLSLLMDKSEDLWFEFIDFESVRRLDDQSLEEWDKLHFRASPKLSPTRTRLLTSEMMPSERIIQRLRSNDGPQPMPPNRPTSPPLYPFSDKMVVSTTVLKHTLIPTVAAVTDFSRDFHGKKLECSALIGSMSELVEGLYINSDAEVYLKASCPGSDGPKGQKLGCAGSATVRHKFKEAKKQDVTDHQLTLKREAFEKLCHKLLFQPPSQKVLASIMLLENATEYIVRMYERYMSLAPSAGLQSYGDLATSLFYLIVDECLSEEALLCPPIKFSLSSCLDRLGDSVISKRPNDVVAIVSRLTSRPSLSAVLPQFFHPELVDGPVFVHVYKEICKISDSNPDTSLVMLSKMSVDNWSSRCLPSTKEKLELVGLIGNFFKRSGIKPKKESKLLHDVHKSNIVKITNTDLPNLLGDVVGFLLTLSEAQSLDPEVWIDLTNGLLNGAYTFKMIDDPLEWATKCASFADIQTNICLPEVLGCVKKVGQHFNKERRNVGLHGLYMKYPEYVKPLVAFYTLQGHLLVTLMGKQTKSLQPDLRVSAIWNQLTFLFDAWVAPLHEANLHEAATWIQQLAGNQKLLMPWAPSDVKLAPLMTAMLPKCAELLHFLIPSEKSPLSHVWEYYCHNFAHPEVRDYVLIVIHEVLLNNVQWSLFSPINDDLRLMVSVIDSFLPICHEFLGRIFVDSLPEIFCRNQWELVRIISPVFHIIVKLSSEPQVRANGRLLPIIRNASSIPWSMVDSHTYENLILWYTMSVDCKVIVNHDQRHPLDTCILSLLREVSRLGVEGSQPSSDVRKFQDFVRCTSRLLVSCSNKQKTFLAGQMCSLKVTLNQLFEDLNAYALKGRTDEFAKSSLDNLVRDILGLFNTNSASSLPDAALEALRASKKATGLSKELLLSVLKMTPSAVHDALKVAKVMEIAIEELFSDGGDDVVQGDDVTTWDEVFKHIVLPKQEKLNQILDQACQSGSCLTIYAFQHKLHMQCEKISDEQSIISTLLACLKKLRLSSSCEPKLPLFYMEFIHLMKRQIDDGLSHYIIIKYINEFLVPLTSIGLESDGSWNFLAALTFTSQYKATVRAKFLALALALFLRFQILQGPVLRTDNNHHELDMTNYQLIFLEEGELVRVREALVGMRKNLGILEMIDWVLEVTQDPKKTFDAAGGFLHHLLVVDNIYTERYLMTQLAFNP